MQFFPLFPIPLTEFTQQDPTVNSHLLAELTQTQFIDNGAQHLAANSQTDHYLHQDPRFAEITQWIRSCLDHYRRAMTYDCDAFDITIMWANRDLAGSATHHSAHAHPCSFISGCYYVTEGSGIYFKDPVIQRSFNSVGVKQFNQEKIVVYPVTAGKLILFPSWLEHGTEPHRGPQDRWSIAFNALPVGAINAGVNGSGNASAVLQLG
jgi:hypothetical protein